MPQGMGPSSYASANFTNASNRANISLATMGHFSFDRVISTVNIICDLKWI